MSPTLPAMRDLVLIGGGHAHALVLRAWGMNPLAGARVTVIDPAPLTAYTGMLPGFIAGHYARADLDIDLVRLARFAGARFICGAVDRVDLQARRIHIAGRGYVEYDTASINVGVHSQPLNIAGSAHAVAVKPLNGLASAWQAFLATLPLRTHPPHVAILGAGIAGAELAMAMAHALPTGRKISLIEQAAIPLAGVSDHQRRCVLSALSAHAVALHTGQSVAKLTEHSVHFDNQPALDADLIVSAVGARAYDWPETSGLACENGFIRIDQTLATSDPAIFAVGDCAHMSETPREKAGVFAVRQAPVLLNNLRAALGAGRISTYSPQRDYLKLISTGGKNAVAMKHGLALRGDWLWRVKNHIDRAFMDKLTKLPEMAARALPEVAVTGAAEYAGDRGELCGGCGAKIGPATLRGGLDDEAHPFPRDDAAILLEGDSNTVISTDHLRGFSEDAWCVAKVAAVHALGDIWAMGARPQSALASVILPPASPQLHQRMLTEIMAGAREAFAAVGAEIIGGHTSEGAELTIGFTVTGRCEGAPIGLGGGRPGDILLLSKPIGVGAILAGEMAKAARGDWVISAYQQMQRSSAGVAEIFASSARAMTDVTGFGLAGHLLNICEASGCGAILNWQEVPVLEGARTLAARGVRSSLWQANHDAIAPSVSGLDARHDLAFDPQTSGGLLAAIPAEKLAGVLAECAVHGQQVWQIGALQEGGIRIVDPSVPDNPPGRE